MSIVVDNISKQFGSFKALDRVSLEVREGTLVALLGPSGSGKSTLLRVIAGLESPDVGTILIDGRNTTHLNVRKRNVGFVFQHYALFKHLTVRQNVAFGLEIRKHPRRQVKDRVEELLDLVHLRGLGDRYPSQLSGGQRQRVALARSLATRPQVLLLDEPFGALDSKVRKELRAWLRHLHEEVRVTSIIVTHDQEEAMEVADEIVVMNQGRIEQVGTPTQIYDHPATPFVMSFIGPVNVLPNTARLFHDNGLEPLNEEVFVRPHDIHVQTSANGVKATAIVQRIIHLGGEIQVALALTDGQTILANFSREQFDKLKLTYGQQVFVKPKAAKSFPLPKSLL
ncbi:MAG: sulfate ABC transporter ATP-binding protein [Chroococcidiopsidaceae cyanobacterium CP_BM_ER_R8_30]|nr:sulfate ABC transporter ATP-binding protein [Chroococcidiopsidaceae cyanobacterium CP_BM_ER_R8_30]